MGHLFISYSHKDTSYAHELAAHLNDMGFETWIDESSHNNVRSIAEKYGEDPATTCGAIGNICAKSRAYVNSPTSADIGSAHHDESSHKHTSTNKHASADNHADTANASRGTR